MGATPNRTITHVDLVCNEVGDKGAIALADSFKINYTIKFLSLYRSSGVITHRGLTALEDTLKIYHAIIDHRIPDIVIPDDNVHIAFDSASISAKIRDKFDQAREQYKQALCDALNGELSGIMAFANQGLSLYVRDENRNSLLHCAAQGGHLSVIRELVRRGLSPTLFVNDKAQTASDLAREYGHAEVAAFLENHTFSGTAAAHFAEPSVANNHTNRQRPSPAIDEHMSRTLNRCLGIGEQRFQQLLGEYQEQGRDSFAKQLEEHEAALSARIEERQEAFTAELLDKEGHHARELVWRVLERLQARGVQGTSSHPVAPDLEEQLRQLTNRQEHERQTLQFQALFIEEINQRQQQLIKEAIYAQEERQAIRDQQSPLIEQYAAKQQRIREQLELQSPPPACNFYNTIEQIFGARISSAVMLVNGCVQRSDTKRDKAVGLGADITGGFCEAIPVVGGVVGSLVSFGIQEAGGAIVDHQQGKKFKNTQAGVIRLKDAMVLSELCARRVAQSYVKHITEESVTPDEAKKAGKRAAKAMYHFLSEGKMQEHAQKPLEEKMDALVKAVHEAGRKEKGIFRKHGGVFDKVTEPDQRPRTSPAQTQQVTIIGRELQDLKEQSERAQAQLQSQIEQLQRRQPGAAAAKISKLTTYDDRQEALRQLNAKSPKAIANRVPVRLSCADQIVTLTYDGAGAEERGALRELAGYLDELFDGAYLKNVSCNEGLLTLKLKSSIAAEDTAQFLHETDLNLLSNQTT